MDSPASASAPSSSDADLSPQDRSALPRRIKTKPSQWTDPNRRKRDQHRIFPAPLLAGMRSNKDSEQDDLHRSPEDWLARQISKKPKIDGDIFQADIPDYEAPRSPAKSEEESKMKQESVEIQNYLDFCYFLSNQWTPELNGCLTKGGKQTMNSCKSRALDVLESCNGDVVLAKFRIMFPTAELVEPSILKKMPRVELERTVVEGEQRFRSEKESAKQALMNEAGRMLRSRVRQVDLRDFLSEHELQENELPEQVLAQMAQAEIITEKIGELPAQGSTMDEVVGLIRESQAVKVVTRAMEEFENEWERAVSLAQKIRDLNSGAVTLRGVQGILKEKKNLQILVDGSAQLKMALAKAQKWVAKAASFFKRPKQRSSQSLFQQHIPEGQFIEDIGAAGSLDQVIEEAKLLELQCLDVVKTRKELVELRSWERRVRMALEDRVERERGETLENLVTQGQQLKGHVPLLEDLLCIQERVRWEARCATLLGGKGAKLKKLEALLEEGESRKHPPVLMAKLKEVLTEATQLQEDCAELLELATEKRGKVNLEDLQEAVKQCEVLQVTVPTKHALARKLHQVQAWAAKARITLSGTRETAKLTELKALLEQWNSDIRVCVKEEQQLRSLVFPTQGFIEKMKKLAKRYEKQTKDTPPLSLQALLAYEKRPCAYEECVALVDQAPEIVKQDTQYKALLQLLQNAVEWERTALALFEQGSESAWEHLGGFRKVPAKRTVVSHVMRLNLVQEWREKLLQSAGCAPFPVLQNLLDQGRQLWSDSTLPLIEEELTQLTQKVGRLKEWMIMKEKMANQRRSQEYYQTLTEEAQTLGLAGTCLVVKEIQKKFEAIQEWKQRTWEMLGAEEKELLSLQKLRDDYFTLDVILPHEQRALFGLMEVYEAWSKKARLALNSRCGWINEYRLKVVVQLGGQSVRVVVYPGEEDDEACQYCVCRSQQCLLNMVACDQCSQWFHVQCLNSLKMASSIQVKYRSLQDAQFVCPFCIRRQAHHPTIEDKPSELLSQQELTALLQEAQLLGLRSPEAEQLKFLLFKVTQHAELVEAELQREAEILPLPRLEQIKAKLATNGRASPRVQKSPVIWRERNLFLKQLYLESLGLPVRGQNQRNQLMALIRARDWIEKCFLHRDRINQYLNMSTVKTDAANSPGLLALVLAALEAPNESQEQLAEAVDIMLKNGGKAFEAKKLLKKVKSEAPGLASIGKLQQMIKKYDEWAQQVAAAEAKPVTMAQIEQLIEDGMYLYLHEGENERLTKMHNNAEQWLQEAQVMVEPTTVELDALLVRYESLGVEIAEVERLRTLRGTLD